MVVAVIIGTFAAISLPNFLAWVNNHRVDNALTEIESAIKEAQREAVRKGVTCEVSINTTPPSLSSTPASCLVTGSRQLGGGWLGEIQLRSNRTTLEFAADGTSQFLGTMVVALPGTNAHQRCIVASNVLGLMRTGDYLASDTTGNIPANCITRQ
jgi:Tfp pilus assembly protein FimT